MTCLMRAPAAARASVGAHVTALAAADLAGQLTAGTRPAESIATTRWMTPALAARLAASPLWKVRTRLALNDQIPLATIRLLLTDPDDNIRAAAAKHPSLPYEEAIVAGRNPLEHPDCPPDLLVAAIDAALDAERTARPLRAAEDAALLHALDHPRLPAHARIAAQQLTSLGQVTRLLWNPATTQAEAEAVLYRVNSQYASTGRTLNTFDTERWARHPNASADWLRATYQAARADANGSSMLTTLARNPSTPPDVLGEISLHEPRYLSRNPSAPPQALARVLTTTADDPSAPSIQLRRDLALNPASPLDLLSQLDADATIPGMLRYEFAYEHGVADGGHIASADHADLVCRMAPAWAGNLADLLYVTADLAADSVR